MLNSSLSNNMFPWISDDIVRRAAWAMSMHGDRCVQITQIDCMETKNIVGKVRSYATQKLVRADIGLIEFSFMKPNSWRCAFFFFVSSLEAFNNIRTLLLLLKVMSSRWCNYILFIIAIQRPMRMGCSEKMPMMNMESKWKWKLNIRINHFAWTTAVAVVAAAAPVPIILVRITIIIVATSRGISGFKNFAALSVADFNFNWTEISLLWADITTTLIQSGSIA